MSGSLIRGTVRAVAALALLTACNGGGAPGSSGAARSTRYEDLVALFSEWRAFQQPKMTDGVPDYSAKAMAAQRSELVSYRARLTAIDPAGWPVAQQVDYRLVQAEMNGLDFFHRVLQPWARDPSFYVFLFTSRSDQPANEGSWANGGIDLWTYEFPITGERTAELGVKLKAIPKLLEQAKSNLVGNAKDLWNAGVWDITDQSENLGALASRLGSSNPELASYAQRAKEATDQFKTWLEQQAPSKTGPSGIGVENYDWWLKNVQLVPYTWRDQVTLMERELWRSHSSLKLEEHRNRKLPALEPVATAEEHSRRFLAGVTDYIAFFRDAGIVTVEDYMDPALRAQVGRFSPSGRPREFFAEVDYRDRSIMLTHDYHWIDIARMEKNPHPDPIRRGPLLYNMFITRTEGFATAMEELMLNAGFFDRHPRARELIFILVAERAARALGDLRMHSNEFTLDQAMKYASEWTPRGWLRLDGNTVKGEQHLYLRQPAYGTSYLNGKFEIDQLIAERAQQLGDKFTLKGFFDEFNDAGLIPASLIRWQLTGKTDEVERMAKQ